MSRIEDEFKKKYGQQKLSNDNYDTEGLWDAITNDLDEDQLSNSGGNGIGKFVLLLVLIVAISAGVAYYISPTFNSNSVSQKSNANKDRITQQTKSIIALEDTEQLNTTTSNENIGTDSSNPLYANNTSSGKVNTQIPLGQELRNTSNQNDGTQSTGPITLRTTSAKNASTSANTQNTIKNNTITSSSLTKELIAKNTSALISKSNKNKTVVNGDDILLEISEQSHLSPKTEVTNMEKASNTHSPNRSTINIATLSPIYQSQIENDFTLEINDQPKEYKEVDNPNTDHISWELNAWTGINTININYKSNTLNDLINLKNQTDKNELGQSFGLKTSILWKKRYLISSGIEYHNMWSIFEVERSTPIQIIKENALLNVWIDGATGDTLNKEYGNILVDADSIRKVKHYNRYQRLSIPIELGLQHQTQKFVFGVSAGAILNFTRTQNGKTLNGDSEIVDFDKESTTRTMKPFSIGLRLNPNIGYRIRNNWTLKIEPQWSWDSNSTFDATDIKINSYQLNLNIGASYTFN